VVSIIGAKYRVYRSWVRGGPGAALALSLKVATEDNVRRGVFLCSGPPHSASGFLALAGMFASVVIKGADAPPEWLIRLARAKASGAYLAVVERRGLADPGPGGLIKINGKEAEGRSRFRAGKSELVVAYGDAAALAEYGKHMRVPLPARAMHVATYLGNRKNNEDSAIVASLKLLLNERVHRLIVAVVADGAGGLKAGEEASRAALIGFVKGVTGSLTRGFESARDIVVSSLHKANEAVLAIMKTLRRQIATTFTGGVITGDYAVLAHVGDSRAYFIKHSRGSAVQITKDHKASPESHVITRALGIAPEPQGDIVELRLPSGSTLLLCTDGVTDVVGNHEIGALAARYVTPGSLANALLSLVKARGAPDNATVALITSLPRTLRRS